VPETSLQYCSVPDDNVDVRLWQRNREFANLHKWLSDEETEENTEDFIQCNLYASKHETSAAASGHIQKYFKCFNIYLTLSQITTFNHTRSLHKICSIQALKSNLIYLYTISYLHHKSVTTQNFLIPFLPPFLRAPYTLKLNCAA
jgi:hypothetical protein